MRRCPLSLRCETGDYTGHMQKGTVTASGHHKAMSYCLVAEADTHTGLIMGVERRQVEVQFGAVWDT